MTSSSSSSSQALSVWRGMGTPAWLRLLAMGPTLELQSAPRIASVTATSLLNSLFNVLESVIWSGRVRETELDPCPVFILGHWRSGTTLLHDLMSLDPQYAFVNLYQALFPGHCLTTERWMSGFLTRFLPETRPMDGMPCAWELPQEDEMALLVGTLLSPYLAVAFPDQPDKYARFEDLKSGLTEAELRQWKDAFLQTLRKAALKQGKPRLLLKSPTHTSRIPLLQELFPNARYVYLVRNPYDVYGSTLKMRRAMADVNRLSSAKHKDLELQVVQSYQKMYQAYHMHRALLHPNQRIEVRFEDLVADPAGVIEGVYDRLELGDFDRLRPLLAARLPEHRQYRSGVWTLTEEQRALVAEQWGPTFRRYKYDV